MSPRKQTRNGRTGRRPGPSSTREDVLRAARHQFAAQGYDRATFRTIAAAAGVDPALVVQFFGSKQDLFVAATTTPAVSFADVAAESEPGPAAEAGLRLARLLVAWLEDDDQREAIVARIRAAASEEAAAEAVRRTVLAEITEVARALGGDRPEVRANLLAALFVGTVWSRYVVPLEPLASIDADSLARMLAPAFQAYLSGPLG